MRKALAFVIAGALALASVAAAAQAPTRIRGTVTGLDGNVLSLKSRDGKDLKVKLADNVTVSAAKSVALADIKPGDFVGPASRPGPDGKLVAISLQVFPAALRGVVPEGHTPWDLEPGSMMTNAIVATVAQAPNGRELKLEYKGGTQTVVVPAGVPVFTTVPGDRSLLVPGATIFTIARPGPDGALSSARISVSKDGVRPAN
ncbi:MAG: hypothetical protein HYY28_13580 [Betaproteobacteria bacterium]|nr:hypothetical protein [Betaproteobacteria bacterium]MBI2961338.1 hypothetical protein [Betaproteobacteria bacterium]